MLNERNRIAREIHDNVGHQLTRALLFTGALRTESQDETTRQSLQTLQDLLQDSMNSIRSSLHDLHDQSIDLHQEISEMIAGFSFCPVKLIYDLEINPDKKTKYAFISIIREALSNIARHSQATTAEITLREHPGFYQLVIRDNGIGASHIIAGDSDGIGLKSIAERVTSIGGLLNISSDSGFVIFITIPKTQRTGQSS
ncbi:MAG TPA: two-component sensor histidine kinase [Clostridiales bacterium]|nr:two-component sensor histidine kinase [Clostridiales bacterium]